MEDRNEEIAKILSTELKLNAFISNVLNYKSVYSNSKDYSELIQKVSYNMTRFLYYEQFLFWMKDYIEVYRKTLIVLLKDYNCFCANWKLYIALMAVSTMKNEFLFRVLEEEFLLQGGDETWLILGLDVVPKKLRHISLLNSLLAHQPWKLQVEDINKLKAYMNVNEIIEAALIMIQFHKMALIEDNLRIKKSFTEKSLFECSSSNGNTNSNNNDNTNENDNNNEIDNDKDTTGNSNNNQVFEDEMDKETQADLIKLMEEIQKEEEDTEELNIEDLSSQQPSFNKITIKQESLSSLDCEKETIKQETILADNMFNKHTCSDNQEYSFKGPHKEIICTYFTFNWCDNGKYTLQNLHQAGVSSLDEEIEYITSINSKSLGQSNTLISTSPIRRAINNYIESLFGYYHEDYNYENITKLLDMKIKHTRYIKKITCYPKKLNNEDLKEMSKIFTREEVVHIILLAALVKSRIQLIYLSKAVNDVMKSID